MIKWGFIFQTSVLIILLSAVPLSGQEKETETPGKAAGALWISPGAETALYSPSGAAYGAGLTLAYGRGASLGLKTAYYSDLENLIRVLEFNLLLRFYIEGGASSSGPFIQFLGGPALIFKLESSTALPAGWGAISGGLCLGWRFLFGKTLFIEPSIRGGYPYLAGAGLSAGLQF